MMLFENRSQAGLLLADALHAYKANDDCIVIGLARGGVVVAKAVANELNLPLDIICGRKISAPHNPEFAIGAITETGEKVIDEALINRLNIPEGYLSREIFKETKEAARRVATYRGNRLPLDIKNKCVILVDDGIATGATMKAAIQSVKAKHPKEIILAVPVAPPDSLEEIRKEVDDVICLAAPIFFQAVGQFYKDFSQTSDEEVINLLKDS